LASKFAQIELSRVLENILGQSLVSDKTEDIAELKEKLQMTA